jgi:glutamyl-tRNA reductase
MQPGSLSQLFVTGISHRTAPVELRELLAPAAGEIPLRLRELQAAGLHEALLLSTCNRVEIYGLGDPALARAALAARLQLDPGSAPLYEHHGEKAAEHLLRVASGLESLITGEPQILGQVKDCYAAARETGSAGEILDPLLQKIFAAAKVVRTQSGIGENPVSVASAAVLLIRRVFETLTGKTALVLGAGEMAELLARHLQSAGVIDFLFVNRTVERAEALQKEFGGRAYALTDLPYALAKADVVVASTGAPTVLVDAALAKTILKKRRPRPLFFIDIAVPRDIDPAIRELDGAYLYDIDDLGSLADAGREERRRRAALAGEIAALQSREIAAWFAAQEIGGAIGEVKAWADALTRDELARLFAQHGVPAEAQAEVEAFAKRLTAKLLHAPITEAKRIAATGEPAARDEGLGILYRFFGGRKP